MLRSNRSIQLILIQFALTILFLSCLNAISHECGEFNKYNENQAQSKNTEFKDELKYFQNTIDKEHSWHLADIFTFFSNFFKKDSNDGKTMELSKYVVCNRNKF